MDITVDAKALARAVGMCRPVADRNNGAFEKHILLTVEGETLTVCGANPPTMSVSASLTVGVKKPGMVCVHAKELDHRLRHVSGEARLSLDAKGMLTIAPVGSKTRRFRLVTLPRGDDFPRMADPNGDALTFDAATLSSLIALTSFSMAPEKHDRESMKAALVELDGEFARMTTTDGHRLTFASEPCDLPARESFRLPSVAIAEMVSMMRASPDESLSIVVSESRVFVRCGSFAISCGVPAGDFPPCDQVVPQNTGHRVIVNREALVSVLLAARDIVIKSGAQFTLKGESLTVRAEVAAYGDFVDTIDVELDSDDIGASVGLNVQYALEPLKAATTETVMLDVLGELDSVVITAGDSYKAVVMPMRLK